MNLDVRNMRARTLPFARIPIIAIMLHTTVLVILRRCCRLRKSELNGQFEWLSIEGSLKFIIKNLTVIII